MHAYTLGIYCFLLLNYRENTDWVSVSNPFRKETDEDFDKAFDEWEKLLIGRQKITNQTIEG